MHCLKQRERSFLTSIPVRFLLLFSCINAHYFSNKVDHFYFIKFVLYLLCEKLGLSCCIRKEVHNSRTAGPRFFGHRSDRFRPEFFSLIFDTFRVHDQIKDQDSSYLLVTLRKKVNKKLFFVVFSHIVLFRFKADYNRI
jgi:hypothetical protein